MSDQLPTLPQVGDLISGRFRITGLVGSGGFGSVFRAVQENVGRDVALKFLSPNVAKDPVNIERFRREAFHVSQLRHPNTITLYDYGQTEDGLFFMVMELLHGTELAEVIQTEGALPPSRAAHVFLQILKSLSEAHQNGLVHRDLKPENIHLCVMFGELDYVKVLDFGVAKMTMLEDDEVPEHALTRVGRIFGTPMYMAPEQACAEPITPATDIYALGLLLFEMLTGLPPVTGRNRMDVIHKQIRDEVPQLTPELKGTPIGDFIRQATQKDPLKRFPHAAAMWEAFFGAIQQMGIVPAPKGALPHNSFTSLPAIPKDPAAAKVTPPAQALAFPQPPSGVWDEVSSSEKTDISDSPHAPVPPEPAEAEAGEAPRVELFVSGEHEVASPHELTAPEQVVPQELGASDQSLEIELPLKDLPLIGREEEVDTLTGRIVQVLQQQTGQFFLLEGESGVGKSRLVAALRESLFGMHVGCGIGQCRQGMNPLDVLRESLASFWWVGGEPREVVDAAIRRDLRTYGVSEGEIDFLVGFIRPDSDDAQTPQVDEDAHDSMALYAQIERAIINLTQIRPMVFILEDIQYADGTTLGFLEYLAVTLRAQASTCAVVLTVRTAQRMLNPDLERVLGALSSKANPIERVRIKRLRGRDLSVLLDAILPMEGRLKERVAWLSQGNPLHAIQIARYLQSSESLKPAAAQEGSHWELKEGTPRQMELPPDLMDMMLLRARQAITIGKRHKHLGDTVHWVAILGIRVPVELLQHVMRTQHDLGPQDIEKHVSLLRRLGILHERMHRNVKCVEFDNSLLRESLLRDLAKDEAHLAKMHEVAAAQKIAFYEAIKLEVPLLEVAEHWRIAGALDHYRDALYAASRRSMTHQDSRGARDQFRELLRLLESQGVRDAMWSDTLLALAALAWRFGELGLAEDRYRQVLRENVLTGAGLARAHRGLAHLFFMLARYAEAIEQYRQALHVSKEEDTQADMAKALIGLFRVHLRQSEPHAGQHVRDQLEKLLVTIERDDIAGKILLHLAEAAQRMGDPTAQQRYLKQALLRYKRCEDHQGLSDTMIALATLLSVPGEDWPKRAERARMLLRDALEIKRNIGDRHGVAEVFRALGTLETSDGDHEAAEYYVQQSLRMHQALGAIYHQSSCYNLLGLCRMYMGLYTQADEFFDQALVLVDRIGDELAVSHVLLNKGIVAIGQMRFDLAKELLGQAHDLKERLGSPWGIYDLLNHQAIVAMWEGDFEKAETYLARCLDEMAPTDLDEDKTLARTLHGLLQCFQGRLQLAALELGRAKGDAEEIRNHRIVVTCRANTLFYQALTDSAKDMGAWRARFKTVLAEPILGSFEPRGWVMLLEKMASTAHRSAPTPHSQRLLRVVGTCKEALKEVGAKRAMPTTL